MRPILITITNLLLFTFLYFENGAQPYTNPFYTKIYTVADGLPDSYILNTYQDSRSYLWVGAYRGLSLFDGKNFRNYGFTNGLPDLYVNCFYGDKNNRVWVSTRKGMGYIKNETYHHTAADDSMTINYVFSYYTGPEGNFYALTSKGLYQWDDNKSVWQKRIIIKRFANEAIRTMVYDKEAYYIAFANYFVKYTPDGNYKILDSSFTAGPQYLSVKKFGDDVIVQKPSCLYRVKEDTLLPLFKTALKELFIYSFLKDSQGRFWVCTDEEGVFVSKPGEEQNFAYKIPLPHNLVSNIYEDKEHNIWLSDYQGLIKVKETFFKIFPPIAKPTKEITNFFHDGDNFLMTYSYDDGFNTYVGNRFKKDNAYNNSYLKILRKDKDTLLDYIIPAEHGTLWAVTRNKKLVRIKANSTDIITVKDSTGNTLRFYYAMYNPAANSILGCSRKLYEVKNNIVKEFTPANKIVISEPVSGFVSSGGNIIVMTRDHRFFVIDKNRNVTDVTKDLGFNVFIPDIDYMEAPDKSIWILVPGLGLRQYHWQNDNHLKLTLSITGKQGLPNDVVTSVCFDKYGRLWASTLSGIVMLESTRLNTEGILPMVYIDKKNFDLNVNINENFARLMADTSGKIWLSAGTEMVLFYPEKFGTMLQAPVLNMEKIRLNLQETDWTKWTDSLNGFFEIPMNIVLPYDMNNFVFHFKGVSFADEGEILYSYKTEGGDNMWSQPFTSNMLTSIRFSPGNYTIYIRAKKANSEWSRPVNFSFTIKQPWWNTWWFRIAGIVVTSAILIIIFRNQTKRIRKNAAVQNQLRELELKALKAQMNPHFIYNALNSIQSLVADKRNEEAQDYMVKFSRLLRQVLNHSEENVITLDKELASLKLYIQLEALRLHYTLQYSIHVDENIVTEREMVPPLILQPFVENALWHGLSEKQGEKILKVLITEAGDYLACEITDNGIGRKEKNAADIIFQKNGPRGMEITRNRLLAFNNNPAGGSISVTDLKNTDGSPAGTTVIIKIRRQ